MRFSHCLGISLALHLAVLGVVRLRGATELLPTATPESPPVEVRVLDEVPIVEETPPEALPEGPIVGPSAEVQAIRRGLGVLSPAPAPRAPDARWSETRAPGPGGPTGGVADPSRPPAPSEPDLFDLPVSAPTARGSDVTASEAPGRSQPDAPPTRIEPDAPASETHAPPAAPVGDTGVGSGSGGSDAVGAGPAPPAAGAGPAPAGPGEGRSGAGAGGEGAGGRPDGTPGAGSPSGSGQGASGSGAGPAPSKPKPKPRKGARTPPFPRSREMQRLEIHGTVRLRLTIDSAGRVVEASVISRSGHPEYDEQVANWVREQWSYPEGQGGSRTVGVSF